MTGDGGAGAAFGGATFDQGAPPPPLVPLVVGCVRLRLGPEGWGYEAAERAAIADFWARRTAGNASLFNGRFFLLTRWRLADGRLEGTCSGSDYASFLHWREAGWPPPAAWNAFAMPVLRAADGGVLIARMAGWTANAGRWYPPAGSLDAEDILADGSIDLVGNMCRELGEEVGLSVAPNDFRGPWTLVFDGGRLAMFRTVRRPEPAADLLRRFEAHLAAEERPELDALRFVSGSDELEGLDAPPFLRPYLRHLFGR